MSPPCQICTKNPSKYKCPTCYLKYCSAPCFKSHRENPCQKPATEQEPPVGPLQTYQYPTEDTVEPEKLEELGRSDEVKECLTNPHVRSMLLKLASCTSDADRAVREAMQEPIFSELAMACLKVVEPEKFD